MTRNTSHSALLGRLLAEIRATAKKAATYRLAGQINKATALEDVVDVLVRRAEKAGHGDEAFLAEQDGQQAAMSSRDPRRKRTSKKRGRHGRARVRKSLARRSSDRDPVKRRVAEFVSLGKEIHGNRIAYVGKVTLTNGKKIYHYFPIGTSKSKALAMLNLKYGPQVHYIADVTDESREMPLYNRDVSRRASRR